jgi:hypothetical protein
MRADGVGFESTDGLRNWENGPQDEILPSEIVALSR